MRHYEESVLIPAAPEEVFEFVDNPARISSHMGESSWMMGGGSMQMHIDEGKGQRIGSHIKLSGKAFGIPISLDEKVVSYDPPRLKIWETVGTPKLVVVGEYAMKVEIRCERNETRLKISIDYGLPQSNAWLGKLFGKMYAKWCVRQMIAGASKRFAKKNSL